MFIDLRADNKQFIVEVPPSLKFFTDQKNKTVDYTYYLAGETISAQRMIAKKLRKLTEKGFKIAVRPHPRYSNLIQVNEVFKGLQIEDCKTTSIEDSLSRTKQAIAVYSTVLNQAYHNGINIIIDDVTDPITFRKLKDLNYVVLQYPHILLSSIIN